MTTISPVRPFSPAKFEPVKPLPGRFSEPDMLQPFGVGYTLASKSKKTPSAKSKPGPLDHFINPQPPKPGEPRLGFDKYGNPYSIPGTNSKPKPQAEKRDPFVDKTLKDVTDRIYPPDTKKKIADYEKKIKEAENVKIKIQKQAEFLKTENPKFKFTVFMRGGRQLPLGATNRGIVFVDIPDPTNPNEGSRRIVVPGINTKSSQTEILKRVQDLCSKRNLIPYVYSGSNKPITNFGTPANEQNPVGGPAEAAHAGHYARATQHFPKRDETKIENSAEAYQFAFDAKVKYLELDLQIDGNNELRNAHDPKVTPTDNQGKATGSEVNINAETDKGKLDAVALSFSKTLKMFDRYPATKMIAEIKDGRGFVEKGINKFYDPANRAAVVYASLKTTKRRDDIIISSMEPQILVELNNLAKADNVEIRLRNHSIKKDNEILRGKNAPLKKYEPEVELKLMRVFPLYETLTMSRANKVLKDMPYVKYVAFTSDKIPNPLDYPYSTTDDSGAFQTKKQVVQFLQAKGITVATWNWDPKNTNAAVANQRARDLGVNINISDMIEDKRDPQLIKRD